MHLQFEFTQADIIDASRRCLARSEAVRAWRMKGLLVSAGLSWLLTFLFFFLVVQRTLAGVAAGLLAGLVTGLLYPGSHRRGVERRLRALYRESHGDDVGPFLCEMELSPVGLWVRQMNTQVTYEWESVESIEEAADGVDVLTRGGGCVVVRDSAFGSPDERWRFIELARGYVELAGAGRGDAGAGGGGDR